MADYLGMLGRYWLHGLYCFNYYEYIWLKYVVLPKDSILELYFPKDKMGII